MKSLGTIDILDLRNIDGRSIRHKKASVDTGKASFENIEKVIDLAMNKKIDASVTGPINKEAINLAGFHYAGHTEIYAEFTHTKDYVMIENLGLKLSPLEGIRGVMLKCN